MGCSELKQFAGFKEKKRKIRLVKASYETTSFFIRLLMGGRLE